MASELPTTGSDRAAWGPKMNEWLLQTKLRPYFIALANRRNARVDIGILGASIAEGYIATSFDRTIGAYLASLLRARHPTTGVTGGRGFIGIPSAVVAGTGMWPLVTTSGTLDDAAFGGKHRCQYMTATGHKSVLTLASAVTSFDIMHVKSSLGAATTGYYKIDGGAAVTFSTFNATSIFSRLHVASAATSTIEVGWNAAGWVTFSGIVEYNGDEAAGIQVHNYGHASYSTAQWKVADTSAGSWREELGASSLDVLIIQDLGINDGYTGNGNETAATFKTDMLAFIASLRSGGISCPIILVADHDVSAAVSLVNPWQSYVTAMAEIAAADSTVVFLDHTARMPAGNASGILYHSDNTHSNATGAAHMFMAETYSKVLMPR